MKILVSHYTLQDKSLLASKWTKLFIGSPNSVFLDWNWISAWLNSIPSTPIVIEAKINEQSVGLGLLCSNTKRILFNTFEIKQLWLHKYGDDEIDQTWIEHNDFLLDSSYEDATREAILSYIKTQFGRWHEFYLGMSQTSIQKKFEDVLGSPRTLVSSADFSVNLEEMHDVNDYLSSLSKNTRSQINRSKKLLAQLGTVTLARAKTKQDKQVYFKKLSQLHQQKWRHTDLGSGFDNPVFVNFHKALILDDINNSYTNIFALELNGDALALVYLLKTNHGWYFYLSGIQTHPDNKIKIGLLTHTLVIEQAIIHGVKKYSFLAGDARYKQSMSNISEEYQSLVCFSKSSGLLKLIEKLRHIKHIMTHSTTD